MRNFQVLKLKDSYQQTLCFPINAHFYVHIYQSKINLDCIYFRNNKYLTL